MGVSKLFPKEHITRIISAVVTAQKKIIAVLISLLLVAFLLLIIMLVNALQKTNISQQKATSIKQGGVNVNLKKEYENPFSTEAQYVNPFSEYKNPFDNLIQ